MEVIIDGQCSSECGVFLSFFDVVDLRMTATTRVRPFDLPHSLSNDSLTTHPQSL